jgi:hypothetical protein
LDKKYRDATAETDFMIESQYRVVNRLQGMLEDLDEQLIVTRVAMDRHLLHVRNDLEEVRGLVLTQSTAQGLLEDDKGTIKRHRRRATNDFADRFTDKNDGAHWMPTSVYPSGDKTRRMILAPEQVSWRMPVPGYKPVEYTHHSVIGAVWADDEDASKYRFGAHDGIANRATCQKKNGKPATIDLNEQGRPINPYGRTGMTGRGLLGKWGVNWAADAVVTRWRRDRNGVVMERDGKKVLEFVAVKRRDGGGWAVPGGFRDNNEGEMESFGREFIEETMNKSSGGEDGQQQELTAEEREVVRQVWRGV